MKHETNVMNNSNTVRKRRVLNERFFIVPGLTSTEFVVEAIAISHACGDMLAVASYLLPQSGDVYIDCPVEDID